jgi:hypothetical protein
MADVIETLANGKQIERDFTAQELKQIELDKENHAAQTKANKAAAIANAKAKSALLEKLGITEDEARLLIG